MLFHLDPESAITDKIRHLLMNEHLVRSATEADCVVAGWLLYCATTHWEDDVGRLARLVGGREKADRIVNRLCEVIR